MIVLADPSKTIGFLLQELAKKIAGMTERNISSKNLKLELNGAWIDPNDIFGAVVQENEMMQGSLEVKIKKIADDKIVGL